MAFFCPHLLIPKRLCNFSLPMALRTVPSQNGHLRDIPTKSHGPGIIIVKIPLIYHLVMTNSNSHGKSPFLSSVNHLFRLGPSIPWRTVSHNQRVIRVGDTAFILFLSPVLSCHFYGWQHPPPTSTEAFSPGFGKTNGWFTCQTGWMEW